MDVITNRTMIMIKSLAGATINKRLPLWHGSAPISAPMQSYRVSGAVKKHQKLSTWKFCYYTDVTEAGSSSVVAQVFVLYFSSVWKSSFSVVIHFINFCQHRPGGLKTLPWFEQQLEKQAMALRDTQRVQKRRIPTVIHLKQQQEQHQTYLLWFLHGITQTETSSVTTQSYKGLTETSRQSFNSCIFKQMSSF